MRRSADVLARIEPVGELVPADLLIEAVVETSEVKEAIFRLADNVLPPQAVLASNTSSIPITSLGAVTSRPERVIGMHFFNPVPVLELVEVIRGLETSDETARSDHELAVDLGKTPAEARDLPGFVSNRILMPFINEAAYALLEGVADRRGDRHDREARVRAPAGAARPRRPDRPRHVRRDHGSAAPRARRSEVRARARFCGSTSRPAASAASPGVAFTSIPRFREFPNAGRRGSSNDLLLPIHAVW